MTRRKAANGLDFAALRRAIEQCDPELLLAFYAEDASLRIVNSLSPRAVSFELHGMAEIAKHLRATFGQKASRRVEQEVVGEHRVTFREACKYSDGDRIVVETTLEAEGGKIVRQVDVVASDARARSQEGSGRGPPT